MLSLLYNAARQARWGGVLGLLLLTSGCGWGVFRHRTAARCEPGLPCHPGYGIKGTVARVPGLTFSAIRLIEQEVPEDILARANAAIAGTDSLTTTRRQELADVVEAAVERAVDVVPSGEDSTEPTPDPISGSEVTETTTVTASESRTVTSTSTEEPQPVRVRYFSLAADQLTVDHCRLANVSLILWSDGRWELFVRAEQNFEMTPEGTPPGTAVAARPQRKQSSHIKRNEFHLVAKGFGSSTPETTAGIDRVAKPVLLHRSMTPFWVERGQPREMTFSGRLDAQQDFDLIRQFEVEFAYR